MDTFTLEEYNLTEDSIWLASFQERGVLTFVLLFECSDCFKIIFKPDQKHNCPCNNLDTKCELSNNDRNTLSSCNLITQLNNPIENEYLRLCAGSKK
jgi:hypothetical protein